MSLHRWGHSGGPGSLLTPLKVLASTADVPHALGTGFSRALDSEDISISNAHLTTELKFSANSLKWRRGTEISWFFTADQLRADAAEHSPGPHERQSHQEHHRRVPCTLLRLLKISVTKADRCWRCVSAGTNLAHTQHSYIICSGQS